MRKILGALLAGLFGLFSMQAMAEEGLIRIDQAGVKAAGGFPYKITQPGSYRLTSNLVVPASANAIMVNASDVVLDLNGFAISCVGNQLAGITEDPVSPTDLRNVKVRHGTVTGCGTAVHLSAVGVDIDDLTISNYTQIGIRLESDGVIRRTTLLGGTLQGSISIFLRGGIVDSNVLLGDSFGIIGGSDPLLVTGNSIQASQSAFNFSSQRVMVGNNVLLEPGVGISALSQGNNLCNTQAC